MRVIVVKLINNHRQDRMYKAKKTEKVLVGIMHVVNVYTSSPWLKSGGDEYRDFSYVSWGIGCTLPNMVGPNPWGWPPSPFEKSSTIKISTCSLASKGVLICWWSAHLLICSYVESRELSSQVFFRPPNK
jgi:hypothetical protein